MLSGLDQLYNLFAIYGIGFAAMSFIMAGHNLHALRCRVRLDLDARELILTRAEVAAWLILGSVGAISTAVALFTPLADLAWPGWVYMLLAVIMPLFARHTNRAVRALDTGAQNPGT